MFQVAVYNDQHHEQFRYSSSVCALRKSASGNWTPVGDDVPSLSAEVLRFSVSQTTIAVESAPQGWQLTNGNCLQSGDCLSLPCQIRSGKTWIEIARHDQPRILVPLKQTNLDELFSFPTTGEKYAGPSAATVTKWLTEASQLHRAAAGSAEFYADAARFAVETIGLDAAWVLRCHEDPIDSAWRIVGSHLPHPELGISFDPAALEQVTQQQGTWYQPKAQQDSQAMVIAPVRNTDGQLVAAVYGIRHANGKNRRRGIRPLEARLAQLLADSVAVGIARLQQETAATRTRVLLEQAFSPTVAEYIQQHPESLSGQEREVTLLFADLRGYSTLAETMQLTDCYELLSDVMETLTLVITRQQGIVVDYYGDGLLALWNAPLDQPNHADLACQAAIEMSEALNPVAKKWDKQLGSPLELGIGIHSGPAYVGNAGTRSRLKYGPRGNTVNLASRVQSASKQLQLPLVITAATQTKLTEKFFTLRVCTAKLPGLEKPAELYTAYPATEAAQVKSRLDEYSHALTLFEAGELEQAEFLLNDLATAGPATPAHFLAHYTAAQKSGNLGRRAIDKYAAGQGPVIEIHSK